MGNVNYSFTENGIVYDFDDVFIPAYLFRQPALWSWGDNFAGQLGVNDQNARSTPVTTILGGTDWKSFSNSIQSLGTHTAAIKTDGTLWVWGSNSVGQLGVFRDISILTPVTTILGGTNWKSVATGASTIAAIKTDGTLWVWGYNNNGQLGLSDKITRSSPTTTLLGGTDWKSVSSAYHTVAIKTDGTLWTWGLNSSGQLGVNDNVSRSIPVTTLLGGTDWKSVSCGRNHTAAIKIDGTLWVWGSNSSALGVNDQNARSTPVTTILGGTDWKSVSAGLGVGGSYTAAIKTDGTLWLWGNNSFGQLGVNNTITRSTPVTTILGGTNWKSVFCGGYHITAIKTDGTLWTWGRNTNGQLGVNDNTDRNTPVTTILGGFINWKISSAGLNSTLSSQYLPDP